MGGGGRILPWCVCVGEGGGVPISSQRRAHTYVHEYPLVGVEPITNFSARSVIESKRLNRSTD